MLLLLTCLAAMGANAAPYFDPDSPNLPNCDSFCFKAFFDSSNSPLISQMGTPQQIQYGGGNAVLRMAVASAYTPAGKYLEHLFRGTLKRPVEEHTYFNINKALVQIDYRLRLFWFPGQESRWTPIMDRFGMDRTNMIAANDSDPVHVANFVMERWLESLYDDGLNAFGAIGPNGENVDYHRVNYTDYTGYEPVNKWNQIRDPDRWQPAYSAPKNNTQLWSVNFGGANRYEGRIQAFVTPQYRCFKHNVLTPREADSIEFPALRDTFRRDREAYERNVQEVIDISANLTDKQKMLAEWWETKIYSFSTASAPVVRRVGPRDLLFDLVSGYYVNQVIQSAMSIVWREKAKYDAPRPFTMAQVTIGNRLIRAWGGPGKGTVTMRGREFQSYLPVGAHPEYPSGSACLCYAMTEAVRIIANGSDVLGASVTFPPGTSGIEPGVTPASSVTVQFSTLSEYEHLCGISRIDGGVHIRPSVDASRAACPQIAHLARPNIERMMAGDLSWYDNARPVRVEGCRR